MKEKQPNSFRRKIVGLTFTAALLGAPQVAAAKETPRPTPTIIKTTTISLTPTPKSYPDEPYEGLLGNRASDAMFGFCIVAAIVIGIYGSGNRDF